MWKPHFFWSLFPPLLGIFLSSIPKALARNPFFVQPPGQKAFPWRLFDTTKVLFSAFYFPTFDVPWVETLFGF